MAPLDTGLLSPRGTAQVLMAPLDTGALPQTAPVPGSFAWKKALEDGLFSALSAGL